MIRLTQRVSSGFNFVFWNCSCTLSWSRYFGMLLYLNLIFEIEIEVEFELGLALEFELLLCPSRYSLFHRPLDVTEIIRLTQRASNGFSSVFWTCSYAWSWSRYFGMLLYLNLIFEIEVELALGLAFPFSIIMYLNAVVWILINKYFLFVSPPIFAKCHLPFSIAL